MMELFGFMQQTMNMICYSVFTIDHEVTIILKKELSASLFHYFTKEINNGKIQHILDTIILVTIVQEQEHNSCFGADLMAYNVI